MRRAIVVFITAVCLLAMVAGCSSNRPSQIAPMSLTAGQQGVVNLIASGALEILLFEYSLNQPFTKFEIWVEVYHYGQLQEHPAGLAMLGDEQFPLTDGHITILINQIVNNEFHWTISVGGAMARIEPWRADTAALSRSFGRIQEAVSIESGREVVLYVSKFTDLHSFRMGDDLQRYVNEPELLAAYTYAHIIKARFTE